MPAIRNGGRKKLAVYGSVASDTVTVASQSESSSRRSLRFRDASTPDSALESASASASPAPEKPIKISGQNLQPTVVFDTLWKWLAERKAIDDRRRQGVPAPWTSDPHLRYYKFCNAYRVLDKTSQFLVKEVIERGSQDPEELLFRILLFNCFTKIETWQLLEKSWAPSLAAQQHGFTPFTAAYLKIGHKLDYADNHMRHLQLLQILMRDLPDVLRDAKYAADVYEQIASYQGMAKFTTYQLMIGLSYSKLLNFSGMDFVVPGPGASSGLIKMFGQSVVRAKAAVPDIEADILRWMARTQRTHFARLGLEFSFLRGKDGREIELDLADLEHAVCEVDKYARKVHPSVSGRGDRKQLNAVFRVMSDVLPPAPTLPKAWNDPARRVVRVRKGPVVVDKRYCVLRILGERMEPEKGKQYKVLWLGYKKPTWEPSALMLQDSPELVEEYLKNKKSSSKRR
ncbi:hypothetical protein C8J57DRAFT_1305341 [Mycena rebaudengoi]|nr:hypothetical protein C8J57DRAFT_1305341 [Mycena rebaudengoi]